jgi:hypothetical protein
MVGILMALLVALLAGLWFWPAAVDVNPPEPPESPGPVVELPATSSHVPVAVTAPLTALKGQLETAVPKDFPFDSRTDVHAYGRPARGPIDIRTIDNNRIEATTTVSGRVQVEKKIAVFDASVGIDVSGRVIATAAPTVARNWFIDPHLNLSATLERAAAKTPVGDIDVTGLVKNKIEELISRERAKIEEAVRKALDMKGEIEKVWKSLAAVHPIGTDPPVWLRVIPRRVAFRNLQYTKDAIQSGLALTVDTQIFVQKDPPAVVSVPLPELDTADKLPDEVTLTVPVVVSYEVMNEQLKKALVEHGPFQLPGGERVTVTGAELRPYGAGLLLKLDFRGKKGCLKRAAGRLYVTGVPVFDAKTGTLRVDELAYTAGTENRLLQAVEWLARDQLLEQMKAAATVDLNDEIGKVTDKAKAEAGRQLDALKKQLPKEVAADTAVTDVAIDRLAFDKERAFVVVKAKGRLAVRLQ